jgi:hypothetical protein
MAVIQPCVPGWPPSSRALRISWPLIDTWTVNTAVQDETTRQDSIMADHHIAISEGLSRVTCLSTDMISMCLNVGLAVHNDTKTRERYACRLVQALNATEHPDGLMVMAYGVAKCGWLFLRCGLLAFYMPGNASACMCSAANQIKRAMVNPGHSE